MISVAVRYQQRRGLLGCCMRFLSGESQATNILLIERTSHAVNSLLRQNVSILKNVKMCARLTSAGMECFSARFSANCKMAAQEIAEFGAILIKRGCCLLHREYTFFFFFLLSK